MAPFKQKRIPAHLKAGHVDRKRASTGRPSQYKPEYCDMVIEAMEAGVSLTAFAGTLKVSREAVYNWMTEHRAFSDAVARAKATRVLWWELKLMRSRKGAETTAAIFALRNADPTEWRDVKHTETTHLHAVAQLSDVQLMEIASGSAGAFAIDVTPENTSVDISEN